MSLVNNSLKTRAVKVGAVFGVWLSGVFAAMLVGQLLAGRNSNVLTAHHDESRLTISMLIVALLWPILYLSFSRVRFIKLNVSIVCKICLSIFAFFSMCSLFFSVVVMTSFAYWILTMLTLFICFQFAKSIEMSQLERAFKLYASIAFCMLSGLSVWEYKPGTRLGENHHIFEPAMIGLVAMSILVTSMAFRNKFLRYGLALVMLFVIYLTGSRAPMLSALFGFYMVNYERTRSNGGGLKTLGFFLLVILILSMALFSEQFGSLIQDFFGFNNKHRGIASGGSGRLLVWAETWELFLGHPVFGVGFRGHEPLLKIGSSAHNGYLALLVEIGIFGFFSILYLTVATIIKVRRQIRKMRQLAYTHSIVFGFIFAYMTIAMFERYFINCGNPASILFLFCIIYPWVLTVDSAQNDRQ